MDHGQATTRIKTIPLSDLTPDARERLNKHVAMIRKLESAGKCVVIGDTELSEDQKEVIAPLLEVDPSTIAHVQGINLNDLDALPPELLTSSRAKALIAQMEGTGYLVADFIPRRSICIGIGDSHIGKSPYLHQLGLCIAAGIPFLGKATIQGRVIYLDAENGVLVQNALVDKLCRFLDLSGVPDDFYRINLNDPTVSGFTPRRLWELVETIRPVLVVVDPLKAVFHDFGKSSDDGRTIAVYQQLRQSASQGGLTIFGVHHLRKQSNEKKPPSLDSQNWKGWFDEARGAREIINGADLRLGFDVPRTTTTGADLVVRGFERLRDALPLEYVRRVHDDDGEPLGYERMQGVDLLSEDDRTAYRKLPSGQLTTGQIRKAYEKTQNPTNEFIKRLQGAGLLHRIERGTWENVGPGRP
jgi:hypothetical protein